MGEPQGYLLTVTIKGNHDGKVVGKFQWHFSLWVLSVGRD